MTTQAGDLSRRFEIGLAAFCACLFAWGLLQPLLGEKADRPFLLIAGALCLQTTATLVANRRVRYTMMATAMVLVVTFFIQR